ncbi:hypothetical protein [Dorea sp. D27]|uniref:hypothetical protein n=1 Tax=Dorea sp. D27 TaxID=658665 RepID=UPI0006731882|nr:hypothetical protein [Dorea sp. D27]KMZ52708.1 hypothetical protein HMPREF0980_03151 [Dorea sp. D27]
MKKGILVMVLLCFLLSALPVLAKETEGGTKQSEEQNTETREDTGEEAEAGTELLGDPVPVTASYTVTVPQYIKAGNNGMIYQFDTLGRRIPFQISVKPRGGETMPYNISVRVRGSGGITNDQFILYDTGGSGVKNELAYSVCKFDAAGQKIAIKPGEEFARLSPLDPNRRTAKGEIVLDDPSSLQVHGTMNLGGELYFEFETEITSAKQQNMETVGVPGDRSEEQPLILVSNNGTSDTDSDADGKAEAMAAVSVSLVDPPRYTLIIPQTIKSGNSGVIYTSDTIRRRIPFQISIADVKDLESGLYNLSVKVHGDGGSSGEFELSGDDGAGNRMQLGYSVYQSDAAGQKTAVNPHEEFVRFRNFSEPDESIAKGEIVLDDPSGLNIGQAVTLKGNLMFEAEVVQNDQYHSGDAMK